MGSQNSSLHSAKKQKNDEFYTQLVDIENELKHYKEHFKGKTVFCNCDDPEYSNFWRYFNLNFDYLGIKRLLATHYEDKKQSYMLEMWRDENGTHSDIKTLRQNGDFRSPECIALLDQADIVVTNPPFSLFREYVDLLVEHNKKFLVIGNLNAVKYKEFFPLLVSNKVWTGYTSAKEFLTPNGEKQKFGNIMWFTNLDHSKLHEKLILYKSYTETDYPKFDNIDVIEVSKVVDIPCDYKGLMAVPISFIDKYCPEQFEIIDMLNRYTVLDYFGVNDDVQKRHSHCCNINGNPTFSRIVIKRID